MEQDLTDFASLQNIIARLRAPDGCPWDREQTHSSIKKYLIEEAYEALETIEDDDPDKLCEELGDLLLQILLHVQIAVEAREFTMKDVVRSISEKIIRRHPHVFGNTQVQDSQEVIANWNEIKKQERKGEQSLLDSVPRHVPALAYSQALQNRVARIGFDWKDFDGILEKVVEEIGELKTARTNREKVHEFGDLLFVLTNVARWLDIDSELALHKANERFYNRFTYMEKVCSERGIQFNELNFEQQNVLWEEAKEQER